VNTASRNAVVSGPKPKVYPVQPTMAPAGVASNAAHAHSAASGLHRRIGRARVRTHRASLGNTPYTRGEKPTRPSCFWELGGTTYDGDSACRGALYGVVLCTRAAATCVWCVRSQH
jgi:hypothetical protein